MPKWGWATTTLSELWSPLEELGHAVRSNGPHSASTLLLILVITRNVLSFQAVFVVAARTALPLWTTNIHHIYSSLKNQIILKVTGKLGSSNYHVVKKKLKTKPHFASRHRDVGPKTEKNWSRGLAPMRRYDLETGPGGNLNVAVPGPDPASNIFKQYYPHGIPKIMTSTIFRHSLSILLFLFKPEFLNPDLVVISMWLCRFRIRQVAFLNNIIYTVCPK